MYIWLFLNLKYHFDGHTKINHYNKELNFYAHPKKFSRLLRWGSDPDPSVLVGYGPISGFRNIVGFDYQILIGSGSALIELFFAVFIDQSNNIALKYQLY